MLGICLSLIDDENDKQRFEQLYYKYRQRMYAAAYRILNNSHDAEDAVQTAFLAAANNFKKISSFSCHETEAYFVIIIRNHSINLYNKNKKTAERSTALNENISIDDDILEKYEYQRLINIISGLPQTYKDVFVLYYVLGFECKEIADSLHISTDAVRKRIERGKKMLREELDKDEQYI